MVDFRTPQYLWDFIKSQWNPQFDAACEAGVNNLATPLRLEEEWSNGVIYSNPPFDTPSIVKWALKGGASRNGSIIVVQDASLNYHDKFNSFICLSVLKEMHK